MIMCVEGGKTRLITPSSGTLWEMTSYAQVIVLIGAGGKTTTLQSLTEEVYALGKNAIGTTTTKVYPVPLRTLWKSPLSPPPQESEYPCFWYTAEEAGNSKWIGPTVNILDQAIRLTLKNSIWVIEGDGAREKKLKCWASHEPQIPSESQAAILMIQGDLWGKILTEQEIHRPEKCPGLVGTPWSGEAAAEYILNSPIFYPRYKKLHWIVLFNEYQVDNSKYFDHAFYIESTLDCLQRHLSDPLSYVQEQDILPAHLRIASGNVKEGRLRWYDLW